MVVETEVGFIVCIQQISIELFAHYLVGYDEFGLAFKCSAHGEHAEVIEQAHEIIGIYNVGSWETVFQLAGDVSLAH